MCLVFGVARVSPGCRPGVGMGVGSGFGMGVGMGVGSGFGMVSAECRPGVGMGVGMVSHGCRRAEIDRTRANRETPPTLFRRVSGIRSSFSQFFCPPLRFFTKVL